MDGRSPVKSTAADPASLTPEQTALWQRWLDDSGHPENAFLVPDFTKLVGRHRPNTRVAILEDAQGIAGFLPYEPIGSGIARPVGSGISDVQALILRPGFTLSANQLLTAIGMSVFEFDRLLESCADVLDARSPKTHTSPVIDLSIGWPEWLQRKRKTSNSRFRRILQKQRLIERELGPLTFTLASEDPADLDTLMAWKSNQFVRTGRRDRFAQPWLRSMMHDLLASPTERLSLAVSTLRAGDHLLAIDVGMSARPAFTGWFPAYDIAYQAYSPGSVCLLMQVEAACNAGYLRMDLGVGEAGYKDSFKDFAFDVVDGWCSRPSAAALLHQSTKVPQRLAMNVVLGNPRLRRTARNALNVAGTMRMKVQRPNS